MSFRFEGYVIVSADGMLADPVHVMPDSLKFEGDKLFFEQALDRAALVVHGRHSHEQQPNSPKRKRLILTRKIKALTVDPEMPNATLWNPDHARFEEACAFADVASGTIAIIGGPVVVRHVHGPLRHVLAVGSPPSAAARRRRLFCGCTGADAARGACVTRDEAGHAVSARCGA
ncbi:hypothetical protein ACVWW4_001355 [Bradyrhizobium sp. LB7.1]